MDPTKCVTVDLSTDFSGVLKLVNPKVMTFNGRRYALVRFVLNNAYSAENLSIEVSSDGLTSIVSITRPKDTMDSYIIMGNDDDHEIMREALNVYFKNLKGHDDDHVTYKIVLRLPFVADPQTSNDLTNWDNGLGHNLALVGNGRSSWRDHFKGFVAVFSERDDGFKAKREVCAYDNDEDMDDTLSSLSGSSRQRRRQERFRGRNYPGNHHSNPQQQEASYSQHQSLRYAIPTPHSNNVGGTITQERSIAIASSNKPKAPLPPKVSMMPP